MVAVHGDERHSSWSGRRGARTANCDRRGRQQPRDFGTRSSVQPTGCASAQGEIDEQTRRLQMTSPYRSNPRRRSSCVHPASELGVPSRTAKSSGLGSWTAPSTRPFRPARSPAVQLRPRRSTQRSPRMQRPHDGLVFELWQAWKLVESEPLFLLPRHPCSAWIETSTTSHQRYAPHMSSKEAMTLVASSSWTKRPGASS